MLTWKKYNNMLESCHAICSTLFLLQVYCELSSSFFDLTTFVIIPVHFWSWGDILFLFFYVGMRWHFCDGILKGKETFTHFCIYKSLFDPNKQ